MSPNDLSPYQKQIEQMCKTFNWVRDEYEEQHERDSECSWMVEHFRTHDGKFLLEESSLTENLLKELLKIAEELDSLRISCQM